MQPTCPHTVQEGDTVYYQVPCGIPIPDPTDHADWDRRVAEAGPPRVRLPMLRPWCPRCRQWKEPLLAADGQRYMAEA